MDPLARVGSVAKAAPVAAARPPIALASRGAGAAAIITGASNLFHGDHCRFSRTGSTFQLVGGMAMVSLKTPKTMHWAATTAAVGTLLNTTHAHVTSQPAKQAIKGLLIGGGAGFGVANHVGNLRAKVAATAIGMAAGALTGAFAKIN